MHAPRRLPEAPVRLKALILARQHCPFAWGVSDCALWAADGVHAVTGVDVAADLRGGYTSALQAARLLQPMGGLLSLVQRRLSHRLAPGIQPLDGDVAVVDSGPSRLGTLAVWWRGLVVGQGADGLVHIPRERVTEWWACA